MEKYCLMYGDYHEINLVRRGLSKERADKIAKKIAKQVEGSVFVISESEYQQGLQAEALLKQKEKQKRICPYCHQEIRR